MAAAAECCASCRLSNRRKKGRTGSCQDYFHLSCVNLTNRSSQKITTWNCKNCLMNYDTQPETNSLDETNTPNDNITVNTNFLKDFVKFKKNQRVLLRIPKAARTSAADALAVAINAALQNGTQSAWENFLVSRILHLLCLTGLHTIRSTLVYHWLQRLKIILNCFFTPLLLLFWLILFTNPQNLYSFRELKLIHL